MPSMRQTQTPATLLRPARPGRGQPAETRERIVAAAAIAFNRDGYANVDAGRIAAEAGYAVGTFYKHFADKKEALIAAYERWVAAEWQEIETLFGPDDSPEAIARRSLSLLLQHHTRWQGLRVSFFSLLNEKAIRKVYRNQRSSQLAMLKSLRIKNKIPAHRAEDDAVLMFTLERVCDAIAQGDVADLGLNRELLEGMLCRLIQAALT
jgi:AcrR family transcriptional regulator